jgi:aryl-alcohol dehydrogenase-like predicted oxidoreductase
MKGATHSGMDAKTATVDVGGAKIPVLGFGTYGMAGPRLQNILVAALQRGFRHIDTAQMYQNEADVGAAIRASGIPRDAIFVTTKVWVDNYIRQRFMASVDESLRRLQSDHIDLLLVHWPRGGAPLEDQIEGLNRAVEEATAHPLAIAESGCTGDLFGRQSALLEHQSGGFEPEIFDRLGGRLSGLSSEHAGELARTETRSFSKFVQA